MQSGLITPFLTEPKKMEFTRGFYNCHACKCIIYADNRTHHLTSNLHKNNIHGWGGRYIEPVTNIGHEKYLPLIDHNMMEKAVRFRYIHESIRDFHKPGMKVILRLKNTKWYKKTTFSNDVKKAINDIEFGARHFGRHPKFEPELFEKLWKCIARSYVADHFHIIKNKANPISPSAMMKMTAKIPPEIRGHIQCEYYASLPVNHWLTFFKTISKGRCCK